MLRAHHAALAAILAVPVAAACSAAIDPGGTGGSGTAAATTGATSGGGDEPDGGAGGDAAPDVVIDCHDAADCAALNDQCNAGTCVNGKCEKVAANEFGSCDDGLYCTENDVCAAGACVGGTSKFCPSLDSCHLGVCDEALQTCKNVAGNDGGACDDGNPCTYQGSCNAGVCTQGPPVDCSLLDGQCKIGVCDPVDGCIAVPANPNQACDDGLYCTIDDKCGAGTCAGVPNTCAAPGDVCMIGSCDEASDKCTAVPGNDGAACDDQSSCTAGETCSAGVCVGGQPANEGVACDDADGCTFGTTCQGGSCTGPTSEITQCIDADACCPAGCTDSDCLYWQSGVLQNVPEAALTGWTECYQDTYSSFNNTPMAQILSQCDKPKLLMGCRPPNSPTLSLAAMGPRLDVLFECGQSSSCVHDANGVGWYYSDSWSWGFAPAGVTVNRNSCDVGLPQSAQLRMCWHTGGGAINGGYRCGDDGMSTFDWERVVYEAD